MSDTAMILLAAGESLRMGAPKQLLDYNGKTLLRHAVEAALASSCRPVFVVLGANGPAIRPALDGLPVEILENSDWRDGMGTSIRTGVSAASAHGSGAVILSLADQPLLSPETYDRLVREHDASGKPIVASRYSGTVGVPVLFSRSLFPALFALEASQGCKGVILGHSGDALLVDCREAAVDIDTPADYRRIELNRTSKAG